MQKKPFTFFRETFASETFAKDHFAKNVKSFIAKVNPVKFHFLNFFLEQAFDFLKSSFICEILVFLARVPPNKIFFYRQGPDLPKITKLSSSILSLLILFRYFPGTGKYIYKRAFIICFFTLKIEFTDFRNLYAP